MTWLFRAIMIFGATLILSHSASAQFRQNVTLTPSTDAAAGENELTYEVSSGDFAFEGVEYWDATTSTWKEMTQTCPPTSKTEYSRKCSKSGRRILRFGGDVGGMKVRIKGTIPITTSTPHLTWQKWENNPKSPKKELVVTVETFRTVVTDTLVDFGAYIYSLQPETAIYLWVQVGGTPVSLDDETVESPTFMALEGQTTLEFILIAEDEEGIVEVLVTIEVAGAV